MVAPKLPPWSSNDPYKKNRVVQLVWETMSAIPVLPPQPDLGVCSVLVKGPRDGRYHVVGDLASMCIPGEMKQYLQRAMAAISSGGTNDSGGEPSYVSREALGTINAGSSEDQTWSAKLLALLHLGHKQSVVWETTVSDYEVETVDNERFWKLLHLFSPDTNHQLLRATGSGARAKSRRGQAVKLFVVRKVVRASKIEIVETRRGGSEAGVALPEALGAVVDLVVPGASALQAEVSTASDSNVHYRITAAGSGQRLMPIAFNGVQVEYANGKLRRTKLTSMATDGPGETAAHASDGGPLQDQNLRDFLDENDWFATVLSG